MRKIAGRLVIVAVLITIIIALGLSIRSTADDSNIQYYTEIQPILNRFPKLEKVNKVYWSTEMIGDHSFGPSTYNIQGYIKLDHSIAQKFMHAYDWSNVSLEPAMQLEHDPIKHLWSYSEEFDQYIKPSNYVGKFYLDSDNELLYFEVEK